MAELVLGTVQFGLNYGVNNTAGKVSEAQVKAILGHAYTNGIKELDTAQVYGDAEIILSHFLNEDKKFTVHSKFILEGNSIKDCLEHSLSTLKVKKLGYFFFHRFEEYLKVKSSLPIISSDKCLGLGVSIYEEKELEQCLGDQQIKAIQLPLNIMDASLRKRSLIQQAASEGKKIYVRSVFLQGLFQMNPAGLPPKLQIFSQPLNTLGRIAATNGKSITDLALCFVKSIPGVHGVLIGVETAKQLEENLKSWNTKLDSSILQELSHISIDNKALLLPKNW